MTKILRNPLLPGFYPDPSVCRRGEDYYLVTSTFEYFPGIPVFHSRDFVHWHQIGHVLSRPDQLNLDGIQPSKGIYASSIFYNEERRRFYVITTLVVNSSYCDNVNFFVWSDDPEGPWSCPVIIKGAEGIDPSLVFDGDEVYYLGNCRPEPEHPEKGRHIWMQKLNLETGVLVGQRYTLLTHGAFIQAAAPEGPHIYHIGQWYYLLIAEGGTFRHHASTIFRSREITGPYEANPRNPLITHRNLKKTYPIHNPGHADMIQLHNGEWWAVLLAVRPVGQSYGSMGRETFAVPVDWEDKWPLFSAETGKVEFEYPAPDLQECKWKEETECEYFDKTTLSPAWVTVRTPRYKLYSLEARPGYLRLFLNKNTVKDVTDCSFVGRRQQYMCFEVETVMEFEPVQDGETGGVVLLMNQKYHIRLEYGIFKNRREVRLTMCEDGQDNVISAVLWEGKRLFWKISAECQKFDFYFSEDFETWIALAEQVDGSILSPEKAGGYTGTMIGMYVTSGGKESNNFADFPWFVIKNVSK